jgi:hypothetical protein
MTPNSTFLVYGDGTAYLVTPVARRNPVHLRDALPPYRQPLPTAQVTI